MEHWWYAHGGIPAAKVIDELPPSLREEVRYRVFQKTTQNSRVFLPLWQQDQDAVIGARHRRTGSRQTPAGAATALGSSSREPCPRRLAAPL